MRNRNITAHTALEVLQLISLHLGSRWNPQAFIRLVAELLGLEADPSVELNFK
jgi:hypothetical protein